MSCVRPEYIADEPGKSRAGNDAMMSELTILFTFIAARATVRPISPLYQLNSHTLIHQ